MKSAAEYGWSWAKESKTAPDAVTSHMQRDMAQLNKSVHAAAGKYSDAAIQKDMKSYMDGVNQLGGCGPGAERLAQLPIFSIHHLTKTVSAIHAMHVQARNPVNIHGMPGFRMAEASAATRQSSVSGTAFTSTSSKIETAVTGDSSHRAGDILNQLMDAGVKTAAGSAQQSRQSSTSGASSGGPNTVSSLRGTSRSTAGPPSPVTPSIAVRSQTQGIQMGGLTRPTRPVAMKTYTPNTQNYAQMNNWMRRDLTPAQGGPEVALLGGREKKFAFSDRVGEDPEVRPDSLLDSMQTATILSVPVDARGHALRWEDLTRYTDYRDIHYTPAAPVCDSCDALLQRASSGKLQ